MLIRHLVFQLICQFSFHSELNASFQTEEVYGSREDPDGEETDISNGTIATGAQSLLASANPQSTTHRNIPASGSRHSLHSSGVKVPNWVMAESSLSVVFNERAETQVQELDVNKVSFENTYSINPVTYP